MYMCVFTYTTPHHTKTPQTHTNAGFLIADGQSGPFRLEIGAISAVGKITGRAPDAAALPPSSPEPDTK